MKVDASELREGVQDGIPICLGYFSVSMAYGMTAVLSGLPLPAAVMISLTNLTSAGQFAGTNLILAGGTWLELAITMLVINIRYFLMSLSMSQKVEEKMTLGQRLGVAFGITDEIFAVAMKHPKALSAAYMAGLICVPILGWVGGTFVGGALTNLLPASISNAFGIALYGMFIAVVVPAAKESKPVLFTAVLAVILSVICYYTPALEFLSGGWSIIVITVIASGAAAVLFPIQDEKTKDSETEEEEREI